MSYTLYKIINKDGNPIDIKVVKEYNFYDKNSNYDDDDVLEQYLETLSDNEIGDLQTNLINGHKIFKVLLEDEKIINKRKENWKKQTLNNCEKTNNPQQCFDALENGQIRLPQFYMDILVVDKNNIVAPAATPVAAQGGTRRRRRNNKKSKRKSKNNRKKTNRRR